MKSIWKSEDKCTTIGCALRHECTTFPLLFTTFFIAHKEDKDKSNKQWEMVVHLDIKCTGKVVHFGKGIE